LVKQKKKTGVNKNKTSPNETCLVTGAFGFSGSYLVTHLLENGFKVVATDLQSMFSNIKKRDCLSLQGFPFKHPNLKLLASDLLDLSSLKILASHNPDYVFHTASLYDYSASYEILMRINVEGTRNLLDALKELKLKRFIHWSTCGVFGKPHNLSKKKGNLPFAEDGPSPKNCPPPAEAPPGNHLVNPYSVSKWVQEQMVWDEHRKNGLPLTVVRPAPIYGPGSNYGHGGIIQNIAFGRLPAIPAATKNAITTSVHVQDMARFALFAALRKESLGEDYNVVDNSIISYHEFLHYIALLTGRNLRDIPLLPLFVVRNTMLGAAHAFGFLEKNFNLPRPKILEPQSATYIGSSYWISNRKSLQTGFQYLYPDVKEGLKDTVTWFKQVGWI